ncbi:hypothetical protein QBC38DRAFT_494000 [Podospora fimiseda]|uniref:Uncharacterized protein n=1 Tax=Podospora fimiseda TaxID=252190 RepID=A0AAN7BGA0_9PEZI|nr:hypothetical protein QBC38DRAFT_494000 [Podospora fimiseda]
MASTGFLKFKTHFQSIFELHELKVRPTSINYGRNHCILLPRTTPITTVYRSPFQHMLSNEFHSHRRLESAKILFISDTGQRSPEAGFPDIQDDGALTGQETAERFTPTTDAIISTFTSSSVDSGPPQSAGWEPFRAYWHDILTKVMKEVEANPNIPYFLSDPPFKKFNVHLYRVDDDTGIAMYCCCLEGGLPNIRIINQNGVARGELVRAVRDHFYGKGLEQTRRV